MLRSKVLLFLLILGFLVLGLSRCQSSPEKKKTNITRQEKKELPTVDSLRNQTLSGTKKEIPVPKFELTDENAIPFFFNYEKENKENKVRIKTEFGNIDIELYENTPYHRANFIYLTKLQYFNGATFHRVVPNFIIQGGNSDTQKIAKKRAAIGRYLLPPDTRKGHSHHRGALSMPSSEIENPHKLASPYEFFIVAQQPGAYHLDGSYTVFGSVIEGLDVVDQINQQAIDGREAPIHNIFMEIEIIE